MVLKFQLFRREFSTRLSQVRQLDLECKQAPILDCRWVVQLALLFQQSWNSHLQGRIWQKNLRTWRGDWLKWKKCYIIDEQQKKAYRKVHEIFVSSVPLQRLFYLKCGEFNEVFLKNRSRQWRSDRNWTLVDTFVLHEPKFSTQKSLKWTHQEHFKHTAHARRSFRMVHTDLIGLYPRFTGIATTDPPNKLP